MGSSARDRKRSLLPHLQRRGVPSKNLACNRFRNESLRYYVRFDAAPPSSPFPGEPISDAGTSDRSAAQKRVPPRRHRLRQCRSAVRAKTILLNFAAAVEYDRHGPTVRFRSAFCGGIAGDEFRFAVTDK